MLILIYAYNYDTLKIKVNLFIGETWTLLTPEISKLKAAKLDFSLWRSLESASWKDRIGIEEALSMMNETI